MKVVHIDTATEWRGGQTQLLHLLHGRPNDVVVLHPESPLRKELPVERVHTVGFRGALGGVLTLRRVLGSISHDLVAAHTSHAHTQALLAARVPVVVHRRLDFRPHGDPLTLRKYQAPLGYVAVSEAVRGVLADTGVSAESIHVVHDGVDPALADRTPMDRVPGRIVAAGALVPHKDHRTLVEAMVEVDGEALVAGEGPEREALQSRIDDLGLRDRVRLLGQLSQEEVWDLIASATAFCHCSWEEGMGQVVVEAMLLGTPVVGTRAGGVPEVIEYTGRLVPRGNPPALARALARALDRPRDPAPARNRARTWFSVESMVSGTTAAYEGLLARQTR